MLITESQLGTGFGRSGMSLLENMSYLTEEESQYHAAMVPIVENARIGANVVALEDIMKFSESNGIEDLGYALSCVCEASGIEANTIAFSVQETSIIGDSEIASLAKDIMNEGAPIVAVPLSDYHPANILAEAAVVDLCLNDDSSLLEAFINDDFGAFLEAEIKMGKAEKSLADAMAKGRESAAASREKDEETKQRREQDAEWGARRTIRSAKTGADTAVKRANLDINNGGEGSEAAIRSAARKYAEENNINFVDALKKVKAGTAGNMSKIASGIGKNGEKIKTHDELEKTAGKLDNIKKESANKPREWITSKIAALNKWANNLKNASGDPGVINRIKEMIGKAIAYLTQKLHNFVKSKDTAAI